MRKPVRVASGRRSPMDSPGATSSQAGSAHLRRYLTALLLLAAVALPCAMLYHADAPMILFPTSNLDRSLLWNRTGTTSPSAADPPDPFLLDEEDTSLERVLNEAAMEDKTVILTMLNAAWASPNSIIDLFVESFRVGDGTRRLLDHLLIIALDRKAYSRCMSIHIHCFALRTKGVDFSGEKHFMSAGYLEMMWKRIDFLRSILEMGYNFIFSDADIIWFRNPMPHFYPDGDFQIACDHFVGNATDLQNTPNGGFNYVKSNNRTIEFYKFWYASRERHPGYHDQDVLNFIKYDPFIIKIGLRMRFLSTAFFGGICEPSKDLNKVCTMHANCCVGLRSKLHDLNVMLEDWRRFMSLGPSAKRSNLLSWRVPQNCSLDLLHY